MGEMQRGDWLKEEAVVDDAGKGLDMSLPKTGHLIFTSVPAIG